MTHRSLRPLWASLALAASPLALQSAQAQTFSIPPSTVFTCDNGMTLDVALTEFDGVPVALVDIPTGRTPGEASRRILPQSQSGSGVRYASDVFEFHLKGRVAQFEAQDSVWTQAIAPTQCVAADYGEALTADNEGADIFVASPWSITGGQANGRRLRQVEHLCFAEDRRRAFALRPIGRGREAEWIEIGEDTYKVTRVEVGDVDAGVSQRRYALSDTADGRMVASMHFIVGADIDDSGQVGDIADPDYRTAPILNSVMDGNRHVRCLASPDSVFTGLTDTALYEAGYGSDKLVARITDKDGTVRRLDRGMIRSVGYGPRMFFVDGTDLVALGVARERHPILDGLAMAGPTPLAMRTVNFFPRTDNLQAIGSASTWALDTLPGCIAIGPELGIDHERPLEFAVEFQAKGCHLLQPVLDDLRRAVRHDAKVVRALDAIPIYGKDTD